MRNGPFGAVQRAYIFALTVLLSPGVLAAQQSSTDTPAVTPDMRQMIAVQVALDRAGFSPGEIDGRAGARTRQALAAFQRSADLGADGALSEETIAALRVPTDALASYTITAQDVAGPFIETLPDDMMKRADLPALAYTTPLEKLAEKFHSSQALLRALNPGATWAAGDAIDVPAVEPFELPSKAEPAAKATSSTAAPARAPAREVVVSGATKSLIVREPGGRILMHAPITVGSEKDPLPVGEWKVTGVSWNPVFNYNPDLFWDADRTHAKATIAAGPNNPVGVVWIDINKAHFGLHGTPEPSSIGRTESHGCIRLTNWDATKLGRLVAPGTPVIIQ